MTDPAQLPAGFGSAADVADNEFARVLVMGAAKSGKTTSLVATADRPLVLNADGRSATKGARRLAPTLDLVESDPIRTERQWLAAVRSAKALVAAGRRTIFVDTLTNLAENLVEDISGKLQGYDLWAAFNDAIMGGIRSLADLDAHLVLIAHIDPTVDEIQGVMPLIPGKAKIKIPALVDDYVMFDFLPERKPHPRMMHLGWQTKWGRNVTRSCSVEPTMPALLQELGIRP